VKVKLLKPDRGYRGSHLWLPKDFAPNVDGIKRSLTFEVQGKAPLFGYEETEHHLVLPREFIPVSEYPHLPFDVDLLEFWQHPPVKFNATTTLRDAVQKRAFASLVEDGSQILCLACGKGKTVISLHAAAAMRLHTVVIVNETTLALQWKARILEHTDVKEEDIGWIQGDRWEWENKPITIVMIHTLVSRLDDIPGAFLRQTGLVIFDETHLLGATTFNQVAAIFHGIRWGLSATWERDDGLEEFYRYHLGPVLYTNLETDLEPIVLFIKTGIKMPRDPARVKKLFKDGNGNISVSKIHTWLSQHPERNEQIEFLIKDGIEHGRTLLCLGTRTEQLKLFAEGHEGSGLIIGKVKGKDREKSLQEGNPVFAISKIAKQGLDRKELDSLLLIFPLRSEGMFRQMMGRILRMMQDKIQPMVIIMEDQNIRQMVNHCRALRGHLNALGYHYEMLHFKDFNTDG
jgi:superfamily II DNA or RNA helicase